MSVIIRLQGLPWSSSALDIRHFFQGLTIPQGGVHIIGGDRGDAFIAFSSDEDARQGMMRNMATIDGTPVKLFLSSRSEMHSVIEEARNVETPTVTHLMQKQGMSQPQSSMQQGAGIQDQQCFTGAYGTSNHQFPQQSQVSQINDNKNQNFLGQGQHHVQSQIAHQAHSKVQGHVQGLSGTGQHGRENDLKQTMNQPSMEGRKWETDKVQSYCLDQDLPYHQHDFSVNRSHVNKDSPALQNSTNSRGYNNSKSQSGKNDRENYSQFTSRDQMQDASQHRENGGIERYYRDSLHSQDLNSRQHHMHRSNQYEQSTSWHNEQSLQDQFSGQSTWERGYVLQERDGSLPLEGSMQHDISPKRGILPTPDLPPQNQQRSHSDESVYHREAMDHGQWPQSDEGMPSSKPHAYNEEDVNSSFDNGHETDFTHHEHGSGRTFSEGRNSDFCSSSPRRRPHDRNVPGPYGGLKGRFASHNERSVPNSPNDNYEQIRGRGFERRPFKRGPCDRSMESGVDEQHMNKSPDGRLWKRSRDGSSFEERSDKRFQEEYLDERGSVRNPLLGRGRGGMSSRVIRDDPNEERERPERGMEGGQDRRLGDRGSDRMSFGRNKKHSGPLGKYDGPQKHVLTPDEYPVEGAYDTQAFEVQIGRGPSERGYTAMGQHKAYEQSGRDRGRRGGLCGRYDGPRVRGGLNRGRGRGMGPQFPSYGHKGEQHYSQEPSEHLDKASEELIRFGNDEYMYPFRGDQDPKQKSGRGHGRSNGSKPDGGMGQGCGQFGGNQNYLRDRYGEINSNESWSTGKGLLGDAPVGLLPTPCLQEDTWSMQHKENSLQRDRDQRSQMECRTKDYQSGKHFAHQRSHCKSADKDHYQYRNDRDRDRGRNRDKDQMSQSRGTDLYSNNTVSSPSVGEKKKTGKISGKNSRQSSDQETTSDSSQSVDSKYMVVKGFPASYSFKEICHFFSGCEVQLEGAKIIRDAEDQTVSEVYLKIANKDHAKHAIEKNGEKILGKALALTLISAEEFDAKTKVNSTTHGTDSQGGTSSHLIPQNNSKDHFIIMIKELPLDIKQEDLISCFSTVKLADNENSLYLDCDIKNQATGVAYMEVATAQDVTAALSYDGHMLGSRALRVCSGFREDMEVSMKKEQEAVQSKEKRKGEQKMTHLPGSGLGVLGPRPPLISEAPRRPNPPPLMSLTPMRMPSIAPRNGPAFDIHMRHYGDEKSVLRQEPNYCVHIQGLPMLATHNDIRDFFSELNIVGHQGVQIMRDSTGKPLGEGFVEFSSQEDKEKALKKDKTSMGRHIVAVKSVAKQDMIERLRGACLAGLPPDQGLPPHPGMSPFMADPPDDGMHPIPLGMLNPKWFYLSCTNLPPAVTIPEVLTFFQAYNPIPESVRLHFAVDGSPTGNAVVGFHKKQDAAYALLELQRKPCRNSVVVLQPAN